MPPKKDALLTSEVVEKLTQLTETMKVLSVPDNLKKKLSEMVQALRDHHEQYEEQMHNTLNAMSDLLGDRTMWF